MSRGHLLLGIYVLCVCCYMLLYIKQDQGMNTQLTLWHINLGSQEKVLFVDVNSEYTWNYHITCCFLPVSSCQTVVNYCTLSCSSYLGRNARCQEIRSVRREGLRNTENRGNNEYVAVNIHCEQHGRGNDKEHEVHACWLIRLRRKKEGKHSSPLENKHVNRHLHVIFSTFTRSEAWATVAAVTRQYRA